MVARSSGCTRRGFLKAAGLGALAAAWSGPSVAAERPGKPNVIVFLVDDMGWMDTTVNGSQYYETPNMARLAKESVVFTDAYAANPLCSPTRASLMTGKYPARLKLTTPSCHQPELGHEPGVLADGKPFQKAQSVESRRYLPLEEYTVAEAVKANGYHTCFIGKWHLGRDEKYWPEYQGFDTNIGGTGAPGPPGGYFDPYENPRLANRKEGEYVTDRVTDEALAYVEAHREEPFFMCFWHYGVHGPWGHKEEVTARYRDKADPRGKQGNPVMASMLWSVDESLGRLMDKLEALDLADETIILFFSDNGGNVHSDVEGKPPTNNAPLRKGKASIYEGGTRVPMMVRWPGVVEGGKKCRAVVSSIDFYPTVLEMTGSAGQEGHVADGVSLVPLLKGGSLEREAYFCHFPHYVPAVDNLPGTYVRKGPWKLIRFYCDGPDQQDRYELYNLKEDLGETKDLSAEYPARVKALNALIEGHLKDIGALVPGKNPKYDPSVKGPTGDRRLRPGRPGLERPGPKKAKTKTR